MTTRERRKGSKHYSGKITNNYIVANTKYYQIKPTNFFQQSISALIILVHVVKAKKYQNIRTTTRLTMTQKNKFENPKKPKL